MLETKETPTKGASDEKSVSILLVLVMIIWGGNFVVLKFGLEQMSPAAFTAIRFAVSAPFFFILSRVFGISLGIKREDYWKIFALGAVYTAFYQVLFATAVAYTTAGNSSLIMATAPLITAIMSYFIGYEKINIKAVLGILLSFLGVFLVVRSTYTIGITALSIKGDILAVFAVIFFASYAVYIKPLLQRYHFIHLLFYCSVIGGALLTLYSRSELSAAMAAGISLQTFLSLCYSIFGVTIFGFSFWYYGISILGPSKTQVFMNLNPVVAVFAGVLVLNEAMTITKIVGLGLTIIGIEAARRNIARIKVK